MGKQSSAKLSDAPVAPIIIVKYTAYYYANRINFPQAFLYRHLDSHFQVGIQIQTERRHTIHSNPWNLNLRGSSLKGTERAGR